MHEDEITQDAVQGLFDAPVVGGKLECPGCAQLVRPLDTKAHALACRALRDRVVWEATGCVTPEAA
jgi:hypothetical protein